MEERGVNGWWAVPTLHKNFKITKVFDNTE